MGFLKLALTVSGIYACFLTWSVLQERVTTTTYPSLPHSKLPSRFKFSFVINIIQSLFGSLVGLLYLRVVKGQWLEKSPSIRNYIWVSFLHTIASPFGYASLDHIDYPTMILAKSCKLVPVMFMSVILHQVSHPWFKYMSVLLITLGVSTFMLQHTQEGVKKPTGTNSLYGLALLTLNMFIDGTTNSTQDHMLKKFPQCNGHRLMVWMNLISSLLMFAYLMSPMTDEFSNALAFIRTHPAVLPDILVFGLSGALGQCFVFYALEHFGSLVLVTVTVTRKMSSMILSVAWFQHHIGIGQWISVAIVFFGIGFEGYFKAREKNSGLSGLSHNPSLPLPAEQSPHLKPQAATRKRRTRSSRGGEGL